MSDRQTPDTESNLSELWMILQDLEDGTLTPDQRQELMARLENSQMERQAYLEYFQQSAIFKMEGAKMHEQGLLPVVDLPFHSQRLFRRSLLTAAAVIAFGAILATLIAIKQPKPGKMNAAVVANTQWTVDGVPQNSDTNKLIVTEGSTVKVASGTVELRLETGAVILLQGPALASFPELHRPILKHGWLWIDSGNTEEPFEVTTPYLNIRDIGTRFGIRVPETGPSEIHLVEGKVAVERRESGEKLPTMTPTTEGLIIPPNGDPTEMTLAYDPFPELPDLLTAKANYRTTLMSQAPIGYWKFELPENDKLANEVRQGIEASYGLEVAFGAPGVGPEDLFKGFGGTNKSVQLLADEEKSTIIDLGGPKGITQREGAVSFWIRRLPDTQKEEALWLAGESKSGSTAPEISPIHTILTDSGRIRLFIENGKFDIELTSSRNVADGKWHHIVASWGPTKVTLFVDGQLAASDEDSRSLQGGTFFGRYVRFGKPSSDLRLREVQPFNGWVDELALWNRPLSPAEVKQQFQSAIGN